MPEDASAIQQAIGGDLEYFSVPVELGVRSVTALWSSDVDMAVKAFRHREASPYRKHVSPSLLFAGRLLNLLMVSSDYEKKLLDAAIPELQGNISKVIPLSWLLI